jgi:hypothetical protein
MLRRGVPRNVRKLSEGPSPRPARLRASPISCSRRPRELLPPPPALAAPPAVPASTAGTAGLPGALKNFRPELHAAPHRVLARRFTRLPPLPTSRLFAARLLPAPPPLRSAFPTGLAARARPFPPPALRPSSPKPCCRGGPPAARPGGGPAASPSGSPRAPATEASRCPTAPRPAQDTRTRSGRGERRSKRPRGRCPLKRLASRCLLQAETLEAAKRPLILGPPQPSGPASGTQTSQSSSPSSAASSSGEETAAGPFRVAPPFP